MSKKDTKKSLAPYYQTDAKAQPMKLYARPEALQKQRLYVALCNVEIGWMGFVNIYPRSDEETGLILPGVAVLEDVFLYPQEVSGGSVDSGRDEGIDLGVVMQNLIDKGEDERIAQVRFFAHSHANMGAYHSGVDVAQINAWAETGLDWFISHVQNKKGEMDTRLDIFTPFRVSVAVELIEATRVGLQAEVEEEIILNVTERKWKSSNPTQGYPGGWQGQQHTSSGWKHLPKGGIVYSEEYANAEVDGLTPDMGTVEKPTIRHRRMRYQANGEVIDIRQEIVKGIVIHEARIESPAARARIQMTDGERWGYWKEFLNDNPGILDPTNGDLTSTVTSGSRSLHRSDDKRDQKSLPPGETLGTESSDQTHNQNDQQKDSKKEQKGKQKGKQQASHDGEKEQPESKREQEQQTLVVEQGEKEVVETNPQTAAERMAEGLEKLGHVL